MGRRLNLKNPRRYTEKLQWYKLYYKNPLMIQCVDKYDVRGYVKNKGCGDILTKCYGVYEKVENIDFTVLPNQFVLKDTLGGGGNSVIVVKNKAEFDIDAAKVQMQKWIDTPVHVRGGGREWPYYSGKKHRIIIEEYISSDVEKGGLFDYKFFCFNGKTVYLYVLADRNMGNFAGLGIFDSEFNPMTVNRNDEKPLNRIIKKPDNYELMKKIAERLSEDFPHARIDMYDENDEIRFGEITFFDGSGYMTFDPDEFDFELGNKFILPEFGGV